MIDIDELLSEALRERARRQDELLASLEDGQSLCVHKTRMYFDENLRVGVAEQESHVLSVGETDCDAAVVYEVFGPMTPEIREQARIIRELQRGRTS